MATTFDNTNRGALFPNNRKTTDKHPDYTGNINIEGVEYWISGWGKVSAKDGKKFVSLSVTKKEAQVAPAGDVLDIGIGSDDIPF